VLLGGILLAEILAFILFYAALVTSQATGIGVLVMVAAENVLFLYYTDPQRSAGYAATLLAWYAGIFIVARPWTLAKLPRLGRPEAKGRRPALD
jgi:hypothetical protein